MNDLKLQAYELGVNAIIGLDLDYTMFGDTIVGVIISGTANNQSTIHKTFTPSTHFGHNSGVLYNHTKQKCFVHSFSYLIPLF